MSDPARRAALEVLLAFEKNPGPLEPLFARTQRSLAPGLPRSERAFANEIVYGVIRWRASLDTLLGSYSKTPLEKIDPPVLTLLRMGLYQLFGMTSVPARAAVNETVNLAKSHKKGRHFVPFINGVLRSASRAEVTGDSMPEVVEQIAGSNDDLALSLSQKYSLPSPLAARWIATYGDEGATKIAIATNLRAPVFFRRTWAAMAMNDQEFDAALAKEGIVAERRDPPSGCYRVTEGTLYPGNRLIEEGLIQPQDRSSQIAASLLGAKQGEKVADLCCGRGTKSGALAAAMKNQGELVAIDHSERKIAELGAAMTASGVDIVTGQVADLLALPPENQKFDRVFLDAPCTSTGVIRRHPEIKWLRSGDDITRLAALQKELLSMAYDHYLRPGGRLVYAICSIEPEEGRENIDWLLSRRAGATILSPGVVDPGYATYDDGAGGLLILPGGGGMDGFFAAIVEKKKG